MQTRLKKRKSSSSSSSSFSPSPLPPPDNDENDDEKNEKKKKKSKNYVVEDDEDYEDEEDEDDDDEDDEDYEDDLYEKYDDTEIRILSRLKQTNPVYYRRFMESKEIIKNREITIIDILKCDIQSEKRANLIEKLECLKNLEPCTEEYIELRDRIRLLYTNYVTDHIFQSSTSAAAAAYQAYMAKRSNIDPENEITQFKEKLKNLVCSPQNRKVLEEKLDDFQDNAKGEEKLKIKRWMTSALSLPFDRLAGKDEKSATEILSESQSFLNKKLFGMQNVKERLLLFLNKKLREGNSRGCNIALVGKPGVGKTAVAKALSECLRLPFAQVSFGGITNAEFLMGHDYTYIGSRPGEITRCLTRMGAKNGILFFDEFDKATDKKDIMSTLLHVTDFSQNYEFRDNYFPELTQDLSKIWFIYSMNELPTDPAMLDRLEIIRVDGYTTEERALIAKDYLFPKYVNELKIQDEIIIQEDGLKRIVDIASGMGGFDHSQKKGVRDLERCINLVIEKIYFFLCNKTEKYNYTWFIKIKECVKEDKVVVNSELITQIVKDHKKELSDSILYTMYI